QQQRRCGEGGGEATHSIGHRGHGQLPSNGGGRSARHTAISLQVRRFQHKYARWRAAPRAIETAPTGLALRARLRAAMIVPPSGSTSMRSTYPILAAATASHERGPVRNASSSGSTNGNQRQPARTGCERPKPRKRFALGDLLRPTHATTVTPFPRQSAPRG